MSHMIDFTTHTLSYRSGFSGSLVLKSIGKLRILQGQVTGTISSSAYTIVADLPAELNGSIHGTQATGVGRSSGDTLTTITVTEGSDKKIELRAVSGTPTWARLSLVWWVE